MRKKVHISILFIFLLISFLLYSQLFSFDQKGERDQIQNRQNRHMQNQQSYDWLLSTPEAQGLNSSIFQKAIQHAKDLEFVDNLLVVRNGYLIVEEYFDRSDKNTSHSIASASKTFIGALVGIAARENLLSLDQKLTDFYPEYVTPNMDPRKHDITIRHMLRMLSGYWDVDTMLSSNRIKYAIEYLPL